MRSPHHPIRLVAFDMEGVLTDDPTVWELMHRKLGTWESHGLPYWNSYRAGKFGYDEFARMDVATWRGARAEMLHATAREVPLMAGCHEVLQRLASEGVHVAIISNGLAEVATRFEQDFGVECIFANGIEVEGARLTGRIDIRVPYAGKGRVLRALAARLGVDRSQIAAIGDSVADIAMFRESGLGIAFCPCQESVALAATHCIRGHDLREALEVLL
jgi:phosphoserine phosphatase